MKYTEEAINVNKKGVKAMKTIVCYGDSNTWGVNPSFQPPGPLYVVERYPSEQRWPNVMKSALGEGYHIIEDGLNGRTAGVDDPCLDYRNGLKTLYPVLLAQAPMDLIIIMLGTNDTKQRIGLTARDIAKGHERMVKAIRSEGCGPQGSDPAVLLVAPPATGPYYSASYKEGFGYGRQTSIELPGVLEKAANALGCYYFDSNAAFTISQIDGLHMDVENHAALGKALAVYTLKNIFV